jgi:SAM-dependent methyltransferase
MRMFRLKPAAPPSIEKHTSNEDTVGRGVIALDIQTKYQFISDDAGIFHEYEMPGSSEIQNIGGYFDKIYKYRDPELLEYLLAHGVSKASFDTNAFPILATRSPQLDLAALPFITSVRDLKKDRVSLLDHGCSAAEHFDFLDVLLKASGQRPAEEVLSYIGLDYSALLLSTAKTLHRHVDERYFRLVHQEGTELNFPDRSIDLTLSVGVVNHVADPPKALRQLLRVTRHACVLALWVTSQPKGFYAINHVGVGAYFFSARDLGAIQAENADGRFFVVEFIPEIQSTQRSSYVGIDADQEASLGCYHLIFSRSPNVSVGYDELTL